MENESLTSGLSYTCIFHCLQRDGCVKTKLGNIISANILAVILKIPSMQISPLPQVVYLKKYIYIFPVNLLHPLNKIKFLILLSSNHLLLQQYKITTLNRSPLQPQSTQWSTFLVL